MYYLHEIIAEHFEEAAFLWLLRERSVNAPHVTLAELEELDERIDAHLEGLIVAKEAALSIVKERLDELPMLDEGEIFASAVIATWNADEALISKIGELISASPVLGRGLASALAWLPPNASTDAIQSLLDSDHTEAQHVGLRASAILRRHPGPCLAAILNDQETAIPLKTRALRAAGELKRVELLPQVLAHLLDDDEGVRFAACWSAVLLGDHSAPAVLKSLVHSPLYAAAALQVQLPAMPQGAAEQWLQELMQRPGAERQAVVGAGARGDPSHVPWLITQMDSPVLARPAGEAFSRITGVDLVELSLTTQAAPAPAGEATDVSAETLDTPDADHHLPWPDAARINHWWQTHGQTFHNGQRYFYGKPITSAHLRQVLTIGYQPQRRAAALELALLQPATPLFEIRAPGFQQRPQLTLLSEA